MSEPEYRIVTHETDGARHTAMLRRSPETDELSDAEIVDRLIEWRRDQQHLRAVDD